MSAPYGCDAAVNHCSSGVLPQYVVPSTVAYRAPYAESALIRAGFLGLNGPYLLSPPRPRLAPFEPQLLPPPLQTSQPGSSSPVISSPLPEGVVFLRARSSTPSSGTRAPACLWAAGLLPGPCPTDGNPSTGTAQPGGASASEAAAPLPPLPGGWPQLRSLSMDLDRLASDGSEALPQPHDQPQRPALGGPAAGDDAFRAPPLFSHSSMPPMQRHEAGIGGQLSPFLGARSSNGGAPVFGSAFHGGGLSPPPLNGLDIGLCGAGQGDPAFEELLAGASPRQQWLFGIAPVGNSCSALPMLNEDSCVPAAADDLSAIREGAVGDGLPDGNGGSAAARRLRGRRMRSASVPTSSRLGGEARAARQQVAVAAGDIGVYGAPHRKNSPVAVQIATRTESLSSIRASSLSAATQAACCRPCLGPAFVTFGVLTRNLSKPCWGGSMRVTVASLTLQYLTLQCLACRVAAGHMAGDLSHGRQAAGRRGPAAWSRRTRSVGRSAGRRTGYYGQGVLPRARGRRQSG